MAAKDTFFSRKHILNIKGRLTDFSGPCVMGILNLTPDSFYSKSCNLSETEIVKQVEKMLSEGAAIIDIGACSSRPGAVDIDSETELNRLTPALSLIAKEFPQTVVSVDTFRANIAKLVVEKFGVAIINDISGGTADPEMFKTIATLKVPYVLMHMRGTPKNMQQYAQYNNVTRDVIFELSEKALALHALGVSDIIIDPGFGFAKSMEQNYELLKNLEAFKYFEHPILAGVSRKSMIYKLLNTNPENALNGTSVLHTIAILKGANILRVHDVKEAMEVIEIIKMGINLNAETQFAGN